MAWFLLAVGLVLAVEGLVFALLPGRLEDIVKAIADMKHETRRLAGLASLAVGIFLIWIAWGMEM